MNRVNSAALFVAPDARMHWWLALAINTTAKEDTSFFPLLPSVKLDDCAGLLEWKFEVFFTLRYR